MLWPGWCKRCAWLSCHKESNGNCWDKWQGTGSSFSKKVLTDLLQIDKKDHLLSSLSLSLRKQFSELLPQYFILAIYNLLKERKLIHRFQKMTKPNSILKWLLTFSCMSSVAIVPKYSDMSPFIWLELETIGFWFISGVMLRPWKMHYVSASWSLQKKW